MRRTVLLAGFAVLCASIGFSFLAFTPVSTPERDLSGLTGDVSRGAYVARLAGCITCHTDPKAATGVLSGGAGIKTPFGTFYPPNITPHKTAGIGNWTMDDFALSLTTGIDPNGAHHYPAYPFPFYTRLKDQDIVDLWSAVMSVPPVAEMPPEHDLSFPFRMRVLNGIWKRLFFHSDERQPDLENLVLERGRYLAQGPGHCGACHTPRNVLGARKSDQVFEGGSSGDGKSMPSITAEELIKKGWTVPDLAYAFRTGIKPDGDVFGGTMAEVIRGSTRYWTDNDLTAIASFLMHQKASE